MPLRAPKFSLALALALALPLTLPAACARPVPQPAPVKTPAHAPATAPAKMPDVAFVTGMMMHHAQAIEMAHLVPSRTTNQAIRLIAERIDRSQVEEISRMKMWLGDRTDSMASMHQHMLMPGMLTEAQLAQLRDATGREFDRLFLQDMIAHHQGALTMVADLFADRSAVRDPVLFQMAQSIDADQRAEIARMRAMLSTLQ